jgi:hypothetical protein
MLSAGFTSIWLGTPEMSVRNNKKMINTIETNNVAAMLVFYGYAADAVSVEVQPTVSVGWGETQHERNVGKSLIIPVAGTQFVGLAYGPHRVQVRVPGTRRTMGRIVRRA